MIDNIMFAIVRFLPIKQCPADNKTTDTNNKNNDNINNKIVIIVTSDEYSMR